MRHETFRYADPYPGIPKPHKAPARDIIERVGAWHHLSREAILGRSRTESVAAARFDAVAAVRFAYPHLSHAAIGRIFGRDRTTIWHALKKRGLK